MLNKRNKSIITDYGNNILSGEDGFSKIQDSSQIINHIRVMIGVFDIDSIRTIFDTIERINKEFLIKIEKLFPNPIEKIKNYRIINEESDRKNKNIIKLLEGIFFGSKTIEIFRNDPGIIDIIIGMISTSLKEKQLLQVKEPEKIKDKGVVLLNLELLDNQIFQNLKKIRSHFSKAGEFYAEGRKDSAYLELTIGLELLLRKLIAKYHSASFPGNPIQDDFTKIINFLVSLSWDINRIIDPIRSLNKAYNKYKHDYVEISENKIPNIDANYILEFILDWWTQKEILTR